MDRLSKAALASSLSFFFWMEGLLPASSQGLPPTDEAIWVRIVRAACHKMPKLCDQDALDHYTVFVATKQDGYQVFFSHQPLQLMDDPLNREVAVTTTDLNATPGDLPAPVGSPPASTVGPYRFGEVSIRGHLLRAVMNACEELASERKLSCDNPEIDHFRVAVYFSSKVGDDGDYYVDFIAPRRLGTSIRVKLHGQMAPN